MAIGAIEQGVNAQQREAVHVLLQFLRMNLPAFHGVALLAVRAKLPAMNIGVAILAMRAGFRKDEAGVALRAADFGVHPEERIFRAVVIEFRITADRFPAGIRVAVLARHAHGPVRVLAVTLDVDLRSGRNRVGAEACQREQGRHKEPEFEHAHRAQPL